MPENNERSVTPFRPFRELSELREEMDRLWERMWGGRAWRLPSLRRIEGWMPDVDVYEKEGAVHVEAELPGLSEKDIQITVSAGGLTLTGEKSEQKEVKEENYYRSERTYGRFSRQIGLPAGADVAKAEASFKDGVLRITIPLREEAKGKTIEVKAG